jgi:hypothetical protein
MIKVTVKEGCILETGIASPDALIQVAAIAITAGAVGAVDLNLAVVRGALLPKKPFAGDVVFTKFKAAFIVWLCDGVD